MPHATAAGTRISYDDLGSGEPALLLTTGWCSTKERWSRVADLCAEHRRVLSTEWRGHGDSDPSPGDFGLEEMVADVLAVVDDAGVERFVPCAASHSGFVALELRRRHPERVPKLVHVDWYVVPPPPPYRAVLQQLTGDDWPAARDKLFEIWTAGNDAPEITGAIDVMRRHGEDMWQRSGREIIAGYDREESPTTAWDALDPHVPVLHLYGQPRDPAFLAVQEEYAASRPWFTVRQLPGVTHFAMLETPDEVAAAIEAFVSA
ncbi:MAG TPA: alpha/beta hydrolase [Gaiellaceae bacterium]|nr:alpha/beta hydrolase [Gaiellaceae bacterium]